MRTGEGFRFTDNQNMPLEFYVGKKWVTKYRSFPPGISERIRIMTEIEFRITARDKVEVPAGSFDCFRVEGRGGAVSPKGSSEIRSTHWYAPEKLRRPAAFEIVRHRACQADLNAMRQRRRSITPVDERAVGREDHRVPRDQPLPVGGDAHEQKVARGKAARVALGRQDAVPDRAHRATDGAA